MRTERRRAGRGGTGSLARTAALLCALACGAVGVAPSAASAQLLAACTGQVSVPELTSTCQAGVQTLHGVRDGLGVGHSGAAALPGTSSALGRRFGVTPRFAIAARVGMVRFDRADPDAWSTSQASRGTSPVFGLSAGLGVFDGFSPAATIGGVLAVDVLGDVSTVRLPSDDGFDEASLAWGYGVRVGILRESFTLPGISLSAMRRSGASFSTSGDEGSLAADVSTTSIRATAGKELLGFGFQVGAGWDRMSADGRLIAAPNGVAGPTVDFDDESDTRFVVFGGAARTFIVWTIGVEAGWSDEVAFGSVSIRLTI